ncbi:hypothetical protein PYJP_10050 [Pyrofollis japonicus]|uniref:hypothetical protein n=1 Tax=Pyrofollis japonicus TaxID=3060460 RepID=UPI00295C3681|nr:hypothetical protein [Pyrofollis japonicus]BEP17653.1 hypothetical protein PYJP_10050 [Pyrofollis japonicus]
MSLGVYLVFAALLAGLFLVEIKARENSAENKHLIMVNHGALLLLIISFAIYVVVCGMSTN